MLLLRAKKNKIELPFHAEREYKNKGWKGWGEFLGSGRIQIKIKVFKL